MPFAQYIDSNNNVVQAIRWDGSQTVADEVIYQIPGISVHLNTIGETPINELRLNNFLTVPEGDWVIISVATDSVTASKMTDAQFNATYTLI